MDQRTDAWHAARAGKFTGSRFADLLAVSKRDGKPLKAYDDLIWQIVTERLTQQPSESITAAALQWGTEVEEYAREAFELETGLVVQEVGFIPHPEHAFIGVSPDGLIGDTSGLEIKCPKNPAIHLERFLTGMPDMYRAQVQGCMWVTGRTHWHFASYDPRMPESHRLLIIPVERDDAFIAQLESAALRAEAQVQAMLESLMEKSA